MPALLESCENYFGTRDLYKLLQISKTATADEVKKAYKKLSLCVHPDRVKEEDKENATEKFKVLSKVHSILNDTEKRNIYDETGCVDEEDDCDLQDRDWGEYWRFLFKEITLDDIVQFEEKYKGSDEELEDIKAAYLSSKGDMDDIFDKVLFATLDQEERYREIIEKLIKDGSVPAFKAFTDENQKKKEKRKRKFEKEAKEAEKAKEEMDKNKKKKGGKKGEEELVEKGALMAILERKKQREAEADQFFEHLANKYGGGGTKKSRNKKK